MLKKIVSYEDLDARKLMDLYREGNIENAEYFYPEMTDKALAVQKCEEDFLNYIKTDFFPREGSEYWILVEGEVWVSALRLYKIADEFYYIEALETHLEFRGKGYASCLLQGVIAELGKRGSFKLCDCVGKTNVPSIRTHIKCGFRITAEPAVDYLRGEQDEECFGMQYISME